MQNQYLQFIHHARMNSCDTCHSLVPGGFGKITDPLMVGARGHGFPLCEHAETTGIHARGRGAGPRRFFLCRGRAHRRRWDAVPAAGDFLSGTPRKDWGIVLMLASLIPVSSSGSPW